MNTLIQKPNSNPTLISAYETFADQTIGIDAQLIKFLRGVWNAGADGEIVKPDARFLAVVTGLRHGHVKWQDNKPVERRMFLVVDHPLPPARIELDDLDENTWSIDKEGKRTDPWVFTFELPLIDLETNGQRLFPTSSSGGRQCIGRLVRTYAQHQRQYPGTLPVVTLGCDSYKHESYGIVQRPILKIVDWLVDPDGAPPESTATPALALNDEIPF